MANEKRLIDANALVETIVNTPSEVAQSHTYNVLSSLAERQHEILNIIDEQPTVDAVEVVFCDECENYGKCYPETIFRLARIEKPFCCVGKRKTNTNCCAKMDGDGNG